MSQHSGIKTIVKSLKFNLSAKVSAIQSLLSSETNTSEGRSYYKWVLGLGALLIAGAVFLGVVHVRQSNDLSRAKTAFEAIQRMEIAGLHGTKQDYELQKLTVGKSIDEIQDQEVKTSAGSLDRLICQSPRNRAPWRRNFCEGIAADTNLGQGAGGGKKSSIVKG